jgi:hypothetical protein
VAAAFDEGRVALLIVRHIQFAISASPSKSASLTRRPIGLAAAPHHLRFAQPPALGRKVSDEFTVPLCRGHHREVHRSGEEAAWWRKAGIDPIAGAHALWLKTHPLPILPNRTSIDGASSGSSVDVDRRKAERQRRTGKQGPNYETKPIIAADHRQR